MKISKKSFFYNAAVLAASGVLLQIIGFVYRVYLSRVAGAEGLGVYRLVFPAYSVIYAATITGIRMAATKLSAGLAGNFSRISHLVKGCTVAFIGLFVFAAVPVLVFHRPIAEHVLGDVRTAPSLIIILFCIFLSGFEGIFECLFLGIGKTKYTAVSNLLEQITQMAGVFLLLLLFNKPDMSVTAALICIGMVISEIPVVIWLVLMYRKEMRGRTIQKQPPKARRRSMKKILEIVLPVNFSTVATNLISSASVVLLPKRLVASGMTKTAAISALGEVSGMAMPLVTLPMILISSLSTVLMPTISKSSATENERDVRRKVRKSFQVTGLLALPATAVIVPLAPVLSRMLYQVEFSPFYLFLLSVAAVFTYYQMLSASILNGLGLQKAAMANIIWGEAADLVLTYVLAARPGLGIYGYIIAMAAGPLLVTALNLRLLKKHAGVLPGFRQSVIVPLGAALCTGLFSRFFYLFLVNRLALCELWGVLAAVAAAAAVYVVILFLVGINPIRYYKNLIPSRYITKNNKFFQAWGR